MGRIKMLALLLAVLLGSVAVPAAAEEGAPTAHPVPAVGSQATGRFFEVRCHFDEPKLAVDALEAIEKAWTHTRTLLGTRSNAPAKPLAVHLYATAADFEAAEGKLTKGRFATNRAFSHHDTKSAHLMVIPDCAPSVRAITGASHHLLRQITHEAAHLSVFEMVPNFRSHPSWLSEGIATHVAEQVSRELGLSSDEPGCPFYDSRMMSLRRMRDRGLVLSPRAILQDQNAHLSTDEKYATWWGFFQFCVAKYPKALRSLLKSAQGLGSGSRYTQDLFQAAEAAWPKGLDALHNPWRTFIDDMAPIWDEEYRSLQVKGATWTQVAYATQNAIAWRGSATKRNYTISGTVRILPSGNQQANVLIGEADGNFISIAIRVGSGITVFDQSNGNWTRAIHQAHDIARSKDLSFSVSVRGTEVRVEINGNHVTTTTVRSLHPGRWGVSVQAGSGSIWRDVTLDS